MKRITLFLLIVATAFPSFLSWGADTMPLQPNIKDKCPVCGMFVARYPDFVAQVLFKDGSRAYFDGSKDMFKFCLNMKKYAPQKRAQDISAIYVTDYYRLEHIDGFKAWYVLGSDIYGPMGREMIPFEKQSDAGEFMKDHKGRSIMRFEDIRLELIRGLD